MRTGNLDKFPDADLEMAAVWTGIFLRDDEAAARKALELLPDERVRHYFDPNRRIGADIANRIGIPPLSQLFDGGKLDRSALAEVFQSAYMSGPAVAYDVCLFYPVGATWSDRAPEPVEWVTQLDPSLYEGIDESHCHLGPQLIAELERIARKLGAR